MSKNDGYLNLYKKLWLFETSKGILVDTYDVRQNKFDKIIFKTLNDSGTTLQTLSLLDRGLTRFVVLVLLGDIYPVQFWSFHAKKDE